MENLPAEFEKRIADMAVGELLSSPFQPVEILRPLGPYGRILDLAPMTSKAPEPEFLVWLLTGHPSHQAYVRHEAGDQYKNLENLIRGRHKVSPTTKHVLATAIGFSMQEIEKLDGSAPDGPLMPGVLAMFQMVEGLPMRIASGVLDRDVPCPCCGNNLLGDIDAWWSEHTPGMGHAECHFAERLLHALIGAGLIQRFVASLQGRDKWPLGNLEGLAHPSRHPIGNWLAEAQLAISRDSLAGLATAMQLRRDVAITFSHGRLKKWSAGQDVMPLAAGTVIAEACGQSKEWVSRLVAARTIALVTDFVAAAMPGTAYIGRMGAQKVVYDRLVQLGSNLQIALAAIEGKLSWRTIPSGNAELLITPEIDRVS
ncbi:MAG: hypothetical protein Q8O33_00625 [Pseudomonadota bacterium]|nr:hypothetical protein [Pseudomonadota bacterium]